MKIIESQYMEKRQPKSNHDSRIKVLFTPYGIQVSGFRALKNRFEDGGTFLDEHDEVFTCLDFKAPLYISLIHYKRDDSEIRIKFPFHDSMKLAAMILKSMPQPRGKNL